MTILEHRKSPSRVTVFDFFFHHHDDRTCFPAAHVGQWQLLSCRSSGSCLSSSSGSGTFLRTEVKRISTISHQHLATQPPTDKHRCTCHQKWRVALRLRYSETWVPTWWDPGISLMAARIKLPSCRIEREFYCLSHRHIATWSRLPAYRWRQPYF